METILHSKPIIMTASFLNAAGEARKGQTEKEVAS